MYSIFVTINVKSEHIEEFKEASLGDAQGATRDEPGCFRFDMHQDAEIPSRFYLHEVYRDEDAFQAHIKAPHFLRWIDTVKLVFRGRHSENRNEDQSFHRTMGGKSNSPHY